MQYPNDCETALRVFCSELTKEINVLEHQKFITLDASIILDLEKQTSLRYLYLARILHAHPNLEKECILTAFSMNPTNECFQLVCKLAETQIAEEATDVATTAAATTSAQNESIDALPTLTCSERLLSSKEYDASRAPNHLLDSLTCLSETVRSDLVSLLTVPRIKNLNWLVPWPELKKECEALLNAEKKFEIVENTTAASMDKLKYINLNYDDFKDFTPHEYPGIEKGYEIYVADSDSEESVTVGGSGRGAGNDDGGGNDSEDTDTAPESKEFIVKESRRIRDRKRRLIKRSQKLLVESENDPVKIKEEPVDGDHQQKKKRKSTKLVTDSIKPTRKRQLKKQKSGEENIPSIPTIKSEPSPDEPVTTMKIEPDIDIKQEPIDDTKFDCDEDVSRTFVDLSNMQQFNGATTNFPLAHNFYPIPPKCEPADVDDVDNNVDHQADNKSTNGFQPHGTNSDRNQEPLSNFSKLTYLPNQFDQSCTAIDDNVDNDLLVNSIILATETNKNNTQQLDEQTINAFPLICDADFDEDEKVDMQFQNIVGNMSKLLGLNSTQQISYLTNDRNDDDDDVTINNNTQSVQEIESQSQSPVINELCPLAQPSIQMDCVVGSVDSSSKISCDVPCAVNATNTNACLQISKPKNPLLAFRKPKKITVTNTIKPNDLATADLSNDSIATNSPLITSSAKPFNFEATANIDWTGTVSHQGDSQNGTTGHSVYGIQPDLSSCNTTNVLPNGQVLYTRFSWLKEQILSLQC